MGITKDGIAKIIDFGFTAKTGTKWVGGSPEYIPMEVAGATPLSYATDVWSFGCILFFMICGKDFFDPGFSSTRASSLAECDKMHDRSFSKVREQIREYLETGESGLPFKVRTECNKIRGQESKCLDLVKKCLVPVKERPHPQELLTDDYFTP